jgi:hypothetical protein
MKFDVWLGKQTDEDSQSLRMTEEQPDVHQKEKNGRAREFVKSVRDPNKNQSACH